MKAVNYYMLRSIVALVLGVLLVLWPATAMEYLVITIGVLFFVPGLIALIGYFMQKQGGMFPIVGVGSLLFGLWLMIMPTFFVNTLMYVLGFFLLLGGIQQIASLIAARKYGNVPFGLFVVPVLILIAGIIVLSMYNPSQMVSWIFILLGISSIVYGLSDLLNSFRLARKRAQYDREHHIEDAKIIE